MVAGVEQSVAWSQPVVTGVEQSVSRSQPVVAGVEQSVARSQPVVAGVEQYTYPLLASPIRLSPSLPDLLETKLDTARELAVFWRPPRKSPRNRNRPEVYTNTP